MEASTQPDAAPAAVGITAAGTDITRNPITAPHQVKDFKIRATWDGVNHAFGVGVPVLVTSNAHPGCILLGQRKGSTGEGMWATPGGHLAFGESIEEVAQRELSEECGLEGTQFVVRQWQICSCKMHPTPSVRMRPLRVQNSVDMEQNFHYIDAFVSCEVTDEPVNKEPAKCLGWFWRHWNDDFPSPKLLFTGLRQLRETDFDPFAMIAADDHTNKRQKTE